MVRREVDCSRRSGVTKPGVAGGFEARMELSVVREAPVAGWSGPWNWPCLASVFSFQCNRSQGKVCSKMGLPCTWHCFSFADLKWAPRVY